MLGTRPLAGHTMLASVALEKVEPRYPHFSLRMRTYDGHGNLVSKAKLIEEAGFVVGSNVVRKADDTEAKNRWF